MTELQDAVERVKALIKRLDSMSAAATKHLDHYPEPTDWPEGYDLNEDRTRWEIWRDEDLQWSTDLRLVLTALTQLSEREKRLVEKIERVLAYKGPKWPDEMSLREKLAYEVTGSINGGVEQFRALHPQPEHTDGK